MSLQVDTINILATGVDCVPKSENAEKKLAGVYDHAHVCTKSSANKFLISSRITLRPPGLNRNLVLVR